MNHMTVTDIMTHMVVMLRPKDSIRAAAKSLLTNHITGAPVVEGGKLVGVVSEVDLVWAYAPPGGRSPPFMAMSPLMFLLRGVPPRDVHATTVSEVMTTDVVSTTPNASVSEAASLIDHYGVRRLPVVDRDGYVVGVVARSDLVRAMVRSDRGSVPSPIRLDSGG